MPKVTFTEPVYFNHLKFGGNVIYKQKGDYIIKRNSKTGIVKFYTIRSGNISFILSALLWPFATIAQIEDWVAYKNNEGIKKSARNAFVKNNLQAIHHYLPSIVPIMDISLPAQYPSVPFCFYAYYDEDEDWIAYEWVDNYGVETYIALGLLRITSKTNKLTPRFTIRDADYASSELGTVPGLYFAAGSKLWASIRACNTRGEVSAWSPYIEIDIPKKPHADFYAVPTSGDRPLTVQFFDQSTGIIRGRLWDFGDGMQSGEINPSHIFFNIPDYYTISLTVFGPAKSHKTKTRKNYIHLTTVEKRRWVIIVDGYNNRIICRNQDFFEYADKFGSQGTLPGYLWYPTDIAIYGAKMWIYDTHNYRIQCFNIPDFTLVNIFPEECADSGVAVDEWNIWVCDLLYPRIMIRDKNTYDYVLDIYGWDYELGEFYEPIGCCIDGSYFYMLDDLLDCMIIWEKTEFIPLYRIETGSSPGIVISNPRSCATDDFYIYITQRRSGNHECIVLSKFDRTLVTIIPLSGPLYHNDRYGISSDNTYLYICLTGDHLIAKYRIADWAFIGAEGGFGSENDQFMGPMGNALWNEE